MVAISRAWYNGSYTVAAKPIKSLELHYTMIPCFFCNNIRPVLSDLTRLTIIIPKNRGVNELI